VKLKWTQEKGKREGEVPMCATEFCLESISTQRPNENIKTESHSSVIELLSKMSSFWYRRAQVKKEDLSFPAFDESKDDFLTELLPFAKHPIYQGLSEKMKSKILSSGWIIYNEKTVQIETKIVNPVCVDILSDAVPGDTGNVYREILSQTMTDESYHVLMVVLASNITRRNRKLDLILPEFGLVKKMREFEEEHREPWQKRMIRFAVAVVSEIFISDYLKLLSEAALIQPLNSLTVAAHRQDELAHKGIFKYLAESIYQRMNAKEQQFFASIIAKPVQWFANQELEVWRTALEQLGCQGIETMLNDCGLNAQKTSLTKVDYSGLIVLAKELGIMDTSIGLDSFHAEGLLN
jgi:alpha-N-dichloroacetyl-p-aminophenylserinol N-oxygenase